MKYVIYRRVSTKQQRESGLGLEAQSRDIDLYFERYSGGMHEIIGEFVDIESGKGGSDRPEFAKAVELAQREKARLLVSKLDRISRDVETIAGLIKQVELKVACMPNADNFQLHIFAALAEQERDFISQRTKAALAAAKKRGITLGGLRDKTGERNRMKARKALAEAEKLRGLIAPMVAAGHSTRQIATALNNSGCRTAKGASYQSSQVSRLIKRLELNIELSI